MKDPKPIASSHCLGRRDFLTHCAAGSLILGLGLARPDRLLAGTRSVLWVEGSPVPGQEEVAYPLPEADGVSVDRDRELILARSAGAVYAFALSCPHQRSLLKWREKDGRFRCTKHGSQYEPDGEYVSGRATRGMDRYAVRIEEGQVFVDMSRKYLQDEDLQGWEGASARIE
jgi:nitrite reductase/ring-hydroxylating ferredoxin subunit